MIGIALRESRCARHLTQEVLARLAGVSRPTVTLIEGGGGTVASFLALERHAPVRWRDLPGGTLGERLRAARGTQTLSLVAERTGLAQNTIRALESGGGNIANLERLLGWIAPTAKALAVPVPKPKRFITVHGRVNHDRDPADYYATPAPVTRLLLDRESFTGRILEPCVGEARALEAVLLELGYSVTSYDLHGKGRERRDIFDITETYDNVVTNPPFRGHIEIIHQAKLIARHKVALLLPLNYLTGARRHAEIWEDRAFPLSAVYVLNRGVDFMADPHGRLKASQMYVAWFVWDRDAVGSPRIEWLDSHALL